ncbi:DUF3605 domain-containing protein [uncultured Endozoicomonas sp.]|uniref:DUF3605 domain-containing protein n=1 Tax=uncultured Endozoicomonas sp. TaxID=432652 RepID=UPI002608B335|nr:DUF3605 domain-containing protein [uncultured Endozoicomonas sp.]
MFNKKYLWALCLLAPLLMAFSQSYADALSWQELETLSPLPPSRSDKTHKSYLDHRERLRAQGLPPEFAVLRNIFGMTEAQALLCIEHGCPNRYELTQNNYGYWLEEGVYQVLMFSTDSEWDDNVLRSKSKELLRQHFPELFEEPGFEWVIYINPPSHRSVTGLAHAHIFLRDRLAEPSRVPAMIERLPCRKRPIN